MHFTQDNSRWRVTAKLSEKEKCSVIKSIVRFASRRNAMEIVEELISYTYLFPREGNSFIPNATHIYGTLFLSSLSCVFSTFKDNVMYFI